MSGTDTPEEMALDQAERGGDEWVDLCLEKLENEKMHDRLGTFIRRYQRKGGENGGPGSLDDLKNALISCGLQDLENIDATFEDFFDGSSYEIWDNILKDAFMEFDDDNKLKFM